MASEADLIRFREHLQMHKNHARSSMILSTATIENRSAATCANPNPDGTCSQSFVQTHVGSVVIAMAAIVPVVIAVIVLIILHRRVHRKQRLEDANDKHASLDFGLDEVAQYKNARNRKLPEMTVTDAESYLKPQKHTRGLSIDNNDPYMLPAGLSGSHESFHSLSRSLKDSADPYRPVAFTSAPRKDYQPSTTRSTLRDDSSVYTGGNSSPRSNEAPNAGLLTHASRMSKSVPITAAPMQHAQRTAGQHQSTASDPWYPTEGIIYGLDSPPMNAEPTTPSNHLSSKPPLPPLPMTTAQPQSSSHTNNGRQNGPPPMNMPPPIHPLQDLLIQTPSPMHAGEAPPRAMQTQPNLPGPSSDEQLAAPLMPNRRISALGMRPLPPDDPSDNPEQRANRIRSFYREYFDESKPNPPGQYAPEEEDDYYGDFMDYGGAVYDPETGQFITNERPYAPPVHNAMSPAQQSVSTFTPRRRSNTSAYSANRGPVVQKRRLPPPTALQSLPTPHMLRDNMSSMSSIDFAPPTSFRDRQLGRRADSPTGSVRPYSPAFKPHMPLARSYDDLAVMPSPHLLRKSATFTALDFAPPPRFKQGDNASDAGSIRSNRSGISARQERAIRDGAYRLSRLPKDTVGAKADIAAALRPTWGLRT